MKRNKEQCAETLHKCDMHFLEKDGTYTVYRAGIEIGCFDTLGELSAFVAGFVASVEPITTWGRGD